MRLILYLMVRFYRGILYSWRIMAMALNVKRRAKTNSVIEGKSGPANRSFRTMEIHP